MDIQNPLNDFTAVRYEKKASLAYVTLNRPQVLNVYNIQMRDELYAILGAIRDDPEVRVVIIKGAGEKAFCAGADLSEFLTAPSPLEARQVRWQRDIWGLFLSIPQPLIAAIHGYTFGSGIEIALCCDLRIASYDAWFSLPETGLGIIPAAGGTQTLPRVIGPSKALDMLLTNRRICGEEAWECGLVNRVVPRERLYTIVEELANKISSYDPVAVQTVKQSVLRGLDLTLEQGLDLEKRLVSRMVSKFEEKE